ncbi:hypothetical protein RJ640_016159 [Escallonia rubra]|uniref:Methyl-CpG-binding domain-containing protein 9 n=1 Tax=Escallonia rubra TaxID=112253 RepID=A0AA88UQQ8_9ASTE|nr:hypothetical protein RJ640_016159 [Escallonia rubra]
MEFANSSPGNAQSEPRSVVLEIDLNEAPLPSPRETFAGGGGGGGRGEGLAAEAVVVLGGSCGKGEGDMLVCCECGKGFHLKCLGAKERKSEWKCFKCLLTSGSERSRGGVGSGGGGVGMLDMNAPPPREDVESLGLDGGKTVERIGHHSPGVPIEEKECKRQEMAKVSPPALFSNCIYIIKDTKPFLEAQECKNKRDVLYTVNVFTRLINEAGPKTLVRRLLVQDSNYNIDVGIGALNFRMQDVPNASFVGLSFIAPVTYSNPLYMENGFNAHKASRSGTHIAKADFDVPPQHRLSFDRSSQEIDLSSKHWASQGTPPKYRSQSPNEIYLQALREYICEKKGVLREGWHVEFDYCRVRCKTYAVYYAPDGSKFESMFDVARHLGLLSNVCSLETEDRGNGFALGQKGSHLRRRKEASRALSANNGRENKNIPRSTLGRGLPSEFEILGQASKFRDDRSEMETAPVDNVGYGSHEGFPVQFEDFFVISLGKVDPRPSYHNTFQIWPVGYRSSWHDKITGSLFICDVLDGGDSGPIFKVRRYPCAMQSIPHGSTVLSKPKVVTFDVNDEVLKDNLAVSATTDDEDTSIQMMLTEFSPPHLDSDIFSHSKKGANGDFDFQELNLLTTKSNCIPQRTGEIMSDKCGQVDAIGEFSVEGRSSASVWEMVSQTILCACDETYKQTGLLQFFCKHAVDSKSDPAVDTADPLSKFCHFAGPINMPDSIQSSNKLAPSCEPLVKWLKQDRFGLEVEFVQELIEQLPGVNVCQEYKFLNSRSQNSTSRTVGSGFLLATRKSGVQGDKEPNGFIRGCKRLRKQVLEDSKRNSCPLGRPLSSKLPAYLIGDVLQAWEFSQRFSEVLGMEDLFCIQDLEDELINPWLDCLNPVRKPATELHNINGDVPTENQEPIRVEIESAIEISGARPASNARSRWTGAILAKAHCSLLKVLVAELLFKVAAYVDPNFDAGESKSRRGRKKDLDNSVSPKKVKLDMLPINDLTWPELARRYILAVLSMEGNLDSAEITSRESGKVFHCLQGDGGILCGSLTGVAAIEEDALLLAEATKRIFGSAKSENEIYSMDQSSVDQKESDSAVDTKTSKVNDSEVPDWAQVLEPVRKLPTNVGARIRKCVYEALRLNPPEWAKKILEYSISKEVYKGNASGPTKRAVVSVLADVVSQENLQPKPEKKERGRKVCTISDVVTKQCRIVLRLAAIADEERVFCNLLGKTFLNPLDNDDEGLLGYPAMVARPLDFRTIDIRLAAGTYGGSHEAFLEDVREVWHNIRTAYGDRSDLIELADSLSQKFEVLYEKEVLVLVRKIAACSRPDCLSEEAKKETDDLLAHASESSLPKAPWDEGVCKVCGMDKDDDNVLLCDTCDSEYHTYCLDPPLMRIPEGNWYCPSCVAGRSLSRAGSCGTQIISQFRKKRRRKEFVHNLLEELAQLVNTMELKEYWEFSVEERVFLIKFLCDEALNLAMIRDHLDQCASQSADLQQKMRSLSSEWKNLKLREDILATSLTKVKANVRNGSGDLGSDASIGELPYKSNYVSSLSASSVPLEEGPEWTGSNSCNKQQCWSFSYSENPGASSRDHYFKASDIAGQIQSQEPVKDYSIPEENHYMHSLSGARVSSLKTELHLSTPQQKNDVSGESALSNFDTEQDTSHGTMAENELSKHANVTHDLKHDMSSLKNEISRLQDSIATLESENLKVSVRKELLGRDSAGRLYWVFGSPGTLSKVVVNGSLAAGESVKAHNNPTENISTSRNLLTFSSDHIAIPTSSSWTYYQSNAEIEELIGWLRDDDPKERELRESILQWQRNKAKCLNAETHLQNEIQLRSTSSFSYGNAFDSCFLVTKARNALEKRFGPCFEPEACGISKKHGCKAKATCEDKLYRCDCLELLWPSRHHCLSCHQTFFSTEDLEEHTKGRCKPSSPIPESKQVDEDSSKRKRMIRNEISVEKGFNNIQRGAAKSVNHDNGSNFVELQKEPGCPFDFEEIRAKFVTRSSLKELVNDIGLIGSNGIPSFVPNMSPYVTDPALSRIPTTNGESADMGNQQKRSGNGMSNRCTDNGFIEEATRTERIKPKFASGKDHSSFTKNRSSSFGYVKCRVIPETSLRPLGGRVSEVLRLLKSNLLDMDAALPEEALRPSRANSEKRCAWRAFIKSAVSIYQMSQATIILEDMIKTKYLRNDWWYWSSASSAARISTLSALALRIYSLDAAIMYEPLADVGTLEISKPGCSTAKESPPRSNRTNNKSSSPSRPKAPDSDLADNSKPKSRTSKRRKDTSG